MTPARAYHTRWPQARQKREPHAQRRRLEQARAYLQREQRRAPRHLQSLEQARIEVGLPETWVMEVEWRLKTVGKLWGNIFGMMCPTRFGCHTADELTRVRGWDKHLPAKVLGALPKRTWVQPWPRRSQDFLVRLWHHVEAKSPATRRRWPWTWVGDDRVFKK